MTAAAFAMHLGFCTGLALLSAGIVWIMTRVGVMDVPGTRSSHSQPTPKGGGVGIVAAFLVGIAILYGAAAFSRIADPYFRAVILAAFGIAIVAYVDDVLAWPAWVKLLAQIAAAFVAVGAGLWVEAVRLPVVGAVSFGWFGAAGSLLWIVFATNAMNFIDGLNGLAAGVTIVTCLCLAVLSAAMGAWFVYFASLILASGVIGFLPFNFPDAKIFMGDVGSQFCGFLLAVLAIAAGRFGTVELSMAIVPMLLFGVLFDVTFTLGRRALAGERLMQAHRGHLYQLAQQRGLPAAWVTVIHWGFALWGGICCGGLLHASANWKPVWVLCVVPPQLGWMAWVLLRTTVKGDPTGQIRGT